MEFSIATLLSHFVEDKLVAGKVLEKKLNLEDETSSEKLHIALDALERIGILVKERGKYRRLYEDDWVEAKLRCSSKGFCFAIQNDEDADDIYIRESHLSNAWNGDRVLVSVIKEGTRRRSPEGEVILILERANPSLLAQVKQENESFRAIPLDDRMLFELELKPNGMDLAKTVNHLVHISVLRYSLGQHLPIGKVTRILGTDAEAAADTDIVCCKHDLPQAFPEAVLAAAEGLDIAISAETVAQRQDLRAWTTFALRPETQAITGTIVEQAFSLQKTADGRRQLAVHISDIASFIAPDSPLDQEARRRGTAIYLGDKILPLLPEAATQQFSLAQGEERLVFSVVVTLDGAAQVIEYEIQPSVIQVDALLSYEQAQNLLDSPAGKSSTNEPIAALLKDIAHLSAQLHQQRMEQGSFDLQSCCVLPFADDGRLGTITVAKSRSVGALVAELIVGIGQLIAAHLEALGVPGIYCTQMEPDWDELEDLLKLSSNLGLDLELSPEEDLCSQDYQTLTQAFAQSSAKQVLNFLLQGTMPSVRYLSHKGHHFGLAWDEGYTQCASPGQRYADLYVQRVLKAVFEEGRDRRHSNAKKGVNLGSSNCHGNINWNVLPPQTQADLEEPLLSLVSHLNDRQKLAEDAEKDLEGLKKAEQMKERTGQVFRGLITGVQSYGFFVEIEDLLVEGLVHVSSLKDDWYEYRARHSCLVGRKNRIAYRLGDEVEVEVKSVDYYRQQIDLATVSGGSEANQDDLSEEEEP